MAEVRSVTDYKDKNKIVDLSADAERRLGEVCKKLKIFDTATNGVVEGLNLQERKDIFSLWEALDATSIRNSLREKPDDPESLAKLGPLTYVTDFIVEELNNFSKKPLDERRLTTGVEDFITDTISDSADLVQNIKKAEISTNNNAAWNVLGDLVSTREAERIAGLKARSVGAATFSGALMVAGVLATFLGGPIGAGIGIPLFVLGVIGGIASASYIGYVRAGEQEPEVVIADQSSWKGLSENDYLTRLKQEQNRLMKEFEDSRGKFLESGEKVQDVYAQGEDEFGIKFQQIKENPGTNEAEIRACNKDLRAMIDDMNWVTTVRTKALDGANVATPSSDRSSSGASPK